MALHVKLSAHCIFFARMQALFCFTKLLFVANMLSLVRLVLGFQVVYNFPRSVQVNTQSIRTNAFGSSQANSPISVVTNCRS